MTKRAPVEIAPGTEVRGFVVEARLGAGGFATVYRARRGERRYALKFIRTQVAGRWAQREVDVLQRLSHPWWASRGAASGRTTAASTP